MSSSNAVALRDDSTPSPLPLSVAEGRYRPALAMPTPEEVAGLKAYGEMIVQSKLFGEKITTWQAAVMIVRYGQQLGVDEFTALTQIYWIKNVPTCSAQLMLSLILRDHGDQAIVPLEMTPEVCRLACRRRGWSQPVEVTYTIEEARTAGLLTKEGTNWKNYAGDMLFARTVSRAGRRLFADTLRGLYTPEEIEAGEVVEVAQGVPGYTVRSVAATAEEHAEGVSGPSRGQDRTQGFTQGVPGSPGGSQGQPMAPPPPPPDAAPESAPAPPKKDARREAEAASLAKDVAAAFGVGADAARQIGAELLRNRWAVADTRALSADQVAAVREGLLRWRNAPADLRAWLAMFEGVTTETMVVDAETILAERGVTDPLILAALATRKERLEATADVG